MAFSMRQRLETAGQQLEQASRLLESTSFQRTLDRGFAIVSTAEGGIIRSASMAAEGSNVSIRFADGQRDAVIAGKTAGTTSSTTPTKTPSKQKPSASRPVMAAVRVISFNLILYSGLFTRALYSGAASSFDAGQRR